MFLQLGYTWYLWGQNTLRTPWMSGTPGWCGGHPPQSLFGPEEVEARLLHVHLDPQKFWSFIFDRRGFDLHVWSCVMRSELTTISSIRTCSRRFFRPD